MCFIPCCLMVCFYMVAFEIGAGYARKMERAKTNARRARAGLPPHFTANERFTVWQKATFNFYIGRHVCPWRVYGWTSIKVPWLFRTGTVGNKMLISTKFFVYGCLFATLLFFLLAFHLNYESSNAFVISVCLGFVFGIGMAFNVATRCVVHLTIPQIFSTKGRSLLLSYVFIMVMTHPLGNFKANLEVMSGTITCAQQLAINSTKELARAAAGPVIDLLKDIRAVFNSIENYVRKLKEAFMAVKRMFQLVADTLVAAKEWLKNNANFCGGQMGTPFNKCQQTFVEVKWTCVKHLQGVGLGFISGVCNVAEWGKVVCYLLKGIEKMCEVTAAVNNLVKDKVAKPVKKAIEKVKNTFYFSVEIDYHYNVTLRQSQTTADILRKVRAEVQARMQPLVTFKHWTNVWVTIMMMLVILKSYKYRRLYLTRDGFDNYYLVPEVEEIDNARRALNKDRVYPMPKREYFKYAAPGSPLLTLSELLKLGKGLIFFVGTMFQVILFISLDFLLYCILHLIQKYGHIEVDQTVPSHTMLHVHGAGVLADIYRALITQFDPMKKPLSFSLDTSKCLPHPTEPNWKIYKTIGVLMLFCFVSVMCQPYVARMRHNIAHKYYPKRQRQRALWLYNNILMRRGSVMFFVRRQVRQLTKQGRLEDGDGDGNDLLAVMAAKCSPLATCLRWAGMTYKYCIACGTSGKGGDMEKFRHCQQFECNTCYCLRCYVQLGNVCTACMAPCDYGDMDDYSDEMDSSDDEDPKPSLSEMIEQRLQEERGSLPSTSTGGGEDSKVTGSMQSYSDAHSSYIVWSEAENSEAGKSAGSLSDVDGRKSTYSMDSGPMYSQGTAGVEGGKSGASLSNYASGSLSGHSLQSSLLGDRSGRVIVPDPSGGSLAASVNPSRESQLYSQSSVTANPSSISHRTEYERPPHNQNNNRRSDYYNLKRHTNNDHDYLEDINRSWDGTSGLSESANRNNSFDYLNLNQHNINPRDYSEDLERSSEWLWTLPTPLVPTRPVVELASMEIFDIIDDLKERFVWRTDWLDHGIGHDGVAWWGDDDDDVPSDQSMQRE